MIENFRKILNEIDGLLAVFPYGSRVYGTATESSDYDFIMVLNNDLGEEQLRIDVNGTFMDFNLYSREIFNKMANEHEISALECLSIGNEWRVYDDNSGLELPSIHLPTLRKSISAKANNSWVKCKKKLTVEEGEELIGKKSLYHSFRIVKFGIQLATHGRIVDARECGKDFFEEIINGPDDWEYYEEKYKQAHNELMTEFRKVAPKE
jgi:hypothetical protein